MPRGDKTGPAGMGPMTGRAAGYCAGYSMPGYMNPAGGRGGFGRGYGRGRGGPGRGMGFGWRWQSPYVNPYYADQHAQPYVPAMNPETEIALLKNDAHALESEMRAIHERIQELESAAQKEKK